MSLQKLGGFASFLLVISFIVAPFIYLTGNLDDPNGPLTYALADLLFGPVWAASLVTSLLALRERIGEHAPWRMSLAFITTLLAAAAMILAAFIRSSNRQYHLHHPELHLENYSMVLIVWTTLVQAVTSAGWHFLGWTLVLLGSAGWSSRRLPSLLCIFYILNGILLLPIYRFPNVEPVVGLCVIWAAWQGILLWRTKPADS